MLRMEIALFLVLAFIACIYFSAGRKNTPLHKTFSLLLLTALVHLVLDGVTVYTVHHLEAVPRFLNDAVHRLFLGSMALVIYLFYQYIAILVEEETGKPRRLDRPAGIFLALAELGNFLLPISYTVTPEGNYSSGPYMLVPYGAVAFYLLLCAGLLAVNWRQIDKKKKSVIGIALTIEFVVCILQGLKHTWLISGMGITLMTLSFYLTLENPDILRAELTEQKMSMLYLKSQVNPHFLYNTLDTIRIQAQLNGDKTVADLLMRLVDFFRLSVKVDRQMVTLDDELELLEAYMDLMCSRYPGLRCVYDIDPDLGGMQVPNFILQPIVENSLLHGLKNKGYRGEVRISAQAASDQRMEILVCDTGSGFAEGKKAAIDQMLLNFSKQPAKLEGSSIGILKISLFERRVAAAAPEKQEERTISGITKFLQAHLAEEISLSVLAEQFHLNPQYISQLFKSEIGVNFLAYLTNIRMEKAKKLLLSTSLSITEIAQQCGYGDYRVFTKVFKKTEGSTPSQYRRDFLEDTGADAR